jgi:DNA-directed RNA polymerase I, II, and III subunit RPABC4
MSSNPITALPVPSSSTIQVQVQPTQQQAHPSSNVHSNSDSNMSHPNTNSNTHTNANDASNTHVNDADADGNYVPSTDIGSHLSRHYDLAAVNNSAPLYICGDCYTSQILRSKDAIRCRDCGYRILYKARMRRPMLYTGQ